LFSSEEEFKNGYRGDLNWSRFINANQSESEAKVPSPDGRVVSLKKRH
jgi:hypothetical protein